MDKFKNKRKRSPNTDASNSEHVGVPIKKKKKESKALVKGVPSESVEEDFPRSSTSLLTPLEIKQLHQKAKQDVTEEKTSKGTKVKRMQMAPLKAVSKAKKMKHSHDIKFPSPKHLQEGLLLLGIVKEVRDYEVYVSLPFNLQGKITHAGVSDIITELIKQSSSEDTKTSLPSLSHLFYCGQYIICSTLRKDGTFVEVTVNPSVINQRLTTRAVFKGMVLPGWVESVEEHGYLISFGIEGLKGFLRKKDSAQCIRQHFNGHTLRAGQVCQFLITSTLNLKALGVSIDPALVNTALVKSNDIHSFNAILPGAVVIVTVNELLSNAMTVKLLGGFEGIVHCRHLPGTSVDCNDFQTKSKAKARLLWVDRAEKLIGLSMKVPIVEGSHFKCDDLEMGTIVESAEITYQEGAHALLLNLSGTHSGYAPISAVYEDICEKFDKKHKVGSKHNCRVVSFNLVDCSVIVSLKQSVLNEPFISYKDIQPGDIVTGTVSSHGSFGMVVQVNRFIHGLCPTVHLADSKLKHPEKKWEKGSEVKCRVLSVDASKQQLLLTHKKKLVDSTYPILARYESAQPGGLHQGVVRMVNGRGCSVWFYGNVRGWADRSDLGQPGITDPTTVFQVGQVVTCQIVSCQPEEKKLQLSFEIGVTPVIKPLTSGDIVTLSVEAILPEGISLRSQEGEVAFLPRSHLSDELSSCEAILSAHQTRYESTLDKGKVYKLDDVLVVCGKLPTRHVLVTCKDSLIKEAKEKKIVQDFSQFKAGRVLSGFVRNSAQFGCFVEFPGNFVGLAPNKYLKDEFVSDGRGVYADGQSVRAKVVEMDREKQRLLVTLRPSDLTPRLKMEHSARSPAKEKKLPSAKSPEATGLVTAKVTKVNLKRGILVNIGPKRNGSIHVTDVNDDFSKCSLKHFKEGDFLRCIVLSKEDKYYVLSLRQSKVGVATGDTPPAAIVDPEVNDISEISEDSVIRGIVKDSTPQGIFVWLGRNLCGRIKFANLADRFVEKPMEVHETGDVVTVKVISIKEKKIELSARLSHIDPEAAKELYESKRKKKDSEDVDDMQKATDSDLEGDSGVESVHSVEEALLVDEEVVIQPKTSYLDVGRFDWNRSREKERESDEDISNGDDDNEAPQKQTKRSKRQKRSIQRLEEQKIYETEMSFLEADRLPETSDDYERLVTSHPNNSSVWIQYILYFLMSADVKKAKAIAERALTVTAFDMENERLNIWVVLLNLENLYGTEESLASVFKSALMQNNQEKLYWKMVMIYVKSGKHDKADSLYKTMIKKFKDNTKVWVGYCEFLMRGNNLEVARTILERSFKSLPKSQHIDIIVKFAEFEYKYGDASRGQTLFENVLTNYPKRLDVWSRYLDQLIKHSSVESIRIVFERAIQLKLSARKMKFFFKRYLEFERQHGTADTVGSVKNKAETFVKSDEVSIQ